jgi:hypothetical protein
MWMNVRVILASVMLHVKMKEMDLNATAITAILGYIVKVVRLHNLASILDLYIMYSAATHHQLHSGAKALT